MQLNQRFWLMRKLGVALSKDLQLIGYNKLVAFPQFQSYRPETVEKYINSYKPFQPVF